MSAPSRRKAKKRVITFTLVVEAQEMVVIYQPNWMVDTGHFEFRSPHEPPRRIPVSETGYRSHFASMEDVEAALSPQDYARAVVLGILRSRGKTEAEESKQPSLF
jgi:hypothetical protein